MKKLLSLLLVATIITSTLCVSYFAIDNLDNLSTVTTLEPTEEETTTVPSSSDDEYTEPSSNISTPDEIIINVSSIKLSRYKATVYTGKNISVFATVYPSNANNKSLTYTSSNTKVATVNNNGVIKGIKAGKVTITVKANDGSNTSAKCVVTVLQKATKIKLNKRIINLSKKGRTSTAKATVYPSNTSNQKVNWKSSNTKIATVNSKGKITAKKKGTTYVKAITTDGSKKSARVLVVVGEKVKHITLSKTSVTINRGAQNKSYKLKKCINNKNATYKAVTWKSSNTKIATVNSKGKITAKKKGTCYVTVTTKDGSNKSAKCKITVKQLITKLSYNSKTQKKELYKGKTIKFAVSVTPSNANNKSVTYTSSNTKIATVNSKGVIKGIKAGTVKITAKAKDGSKKTTSITVKVKNPPITNDTKLTIKQLKSESIVKRHCDMLNDYFKSCGATIEPRLKGTHQWYVENTSGYCIDNWKSLNDWYIETLGYWIQEMSTDVLRNNGEWNGIKDSESYEKFYDSFLYKDKEGCWIYKKDLVLDSKYNGFDWLINDWITKYDANDKMLVYVDYEKIKINGKDCKDNNGNQEYIIKFYYDCQSNVDAVGWDWLKDY